MINAGKMKQPPATTRPAPPARRRPTWMVSSVDVGPGIRLAAPSRSRNSSCVSHPRRPTISRSIMAMCPAGPPNAVAPSRRNSAASSHSGRGRFATGGVTTGGWGRRPGGASGPRRGSALAALDQRGPGPLLDLRPEELEDLVVPPSGVAPPQGDELAGEGAVEEQVRQKVRLVGGLAFRQPREHALEQARAAAAEPGRAHERGGELADVLGGADLEQRDRADLGAATLDEGAVDLAHELRPEPTLAGREQAVDQLELLDVGVDAIERQRVERLAQQIERPREGALSRRGRR